MEQRNRSEKERDVNAEDGKGLMKIRRSRG